MTWRRRTGIVTAPQGMVTHVEGYLTDRGVVAVVEHFEVTAQSLQITVATTEDDQVAHAGDGLITPGATLAEFAQDLAHHINGEVVFADGRWVGENTPPPSADPFEQPLGADIAAYADRAAVFTRASHEGVEEIASQVQDVVYSLQHGGGHIVFITEGPILATVYWDDQARPVMIMEHGTTQPTLTLIPTHPGDDPLIHTWHAPKTTTPTTPHEAVPGFIDATLGRGAIVRELMRLFPATEPAHVRASLDEGPTQLIQALGLPTQVWDYLDSQVPAPDIDGVTAVHPASFARSVRRAVTEASTTVSERAEAMRKRAVQVRTRAETAFDAAEAFAEEVILPVRQNWVSPALAVAETTLGLLALRKARDNRGLPAGALVTLGVVLLGDAAVNTVISLAPFLRRKNQAR